MNLLTDHFILLLYECRGRSCLIPYDSKSATPWKIRKYWRVDEGKKNECPRDKDDNLVSKETACRKHITSLSLRSVWGILTRPSFKLSVTNCHNIENEALAFHFFGTFEHTPSLSSPLAGRRRVVLK